MKKLLYPAVAALALAGTGIAGTPMYTSKDPVAPEPCFNDVELQLDVFGSYNDGRARADRGDGWGGGLGVNYFFTRILGFGAAANLYDGDGEGEWNFDFDVIARFPIEGGVCIAPYVLAGGGLATNGNTVGTWNVGGGLEWRATSSFGVFGEGRYIWGAQDEDTVTARVGLRFVF
jgi:hypothetical protein